MQWMSSHIRGNITETALLEVTVLSGTHIKFKEVLLLLGGNLVVGSEGQVVDFYTLPQVHSLHELNRRQCVMFHYFISLILKSSVLTNPKCKTSFSFKGISNHIRDSKCDIELEYKQSIEKVAQFCIDLVLFDSTI